MSAADTLAVLYVDDDQDIRHIVRLSLSLDPAIDLRVAASGREALALLAEDAWRPALVMLDVMMPGINGRDLMRQIRTDHRLEDVPFVFNTANARESDVANYLDSGAFEVITKPFDPMTLSAQLRVIAARYADRSEGQGRL